MFDDRYCLTKAVLEGRKTMTRRIIQAPETWHGFDVYGFSVNRDNRGEVFDITLLNADGGCIEDVSGNFGMIFPKYHINETVAVAQSYKNAGYASATIQEGRAVRKSVHSEDWDDYMIGKLGEWYIDQLAGWNNKMFTYPEMMPHQIRITDIKVERLRDISDEDMLKEGLSHIETKWGYWEEVRESLKFYSYETKRKAFAALIDKVSGKGTWDSNPYCFCYEFELVK